MGKYTTQVRSICETYAGLLESVGYDKVDEIIESARSKVFDFDYPIFDKAYKGVLETKILKHFYTKEIGAETVGLWELWLNTRMNEIMPYYNKLYKSELLEFNPLYDIDYTRTQSGSKTGSKEETGERAETSKGNKSATGETTGTSTENGTRTGETTGTNTENDTRTGASNTTQTGNSSETIITTDTANNSKTENNYYSDTPQGGVDGLETLTYLTNARKISENGNSSLTSNKTDENNTTNSSENEYNESVKSTGETSGTTSETIKNTGETSGTTLETIVTNNEISGTNTANSVFNNTEEYLEKVQGKQGGTSYSKMLEEYRTTFLNIDMQVINELNDLFINLW